MYKFFLSIIFLLLLAFSAALFSANKDKTINVVEFGKNQGAGNLLGIQPNLENIHYSSYEAFYREMNRYLEEAKNKKFLNHKTIAVYPETIGMWLAAANESEYIYSKKDARNAVLPIIIRNFGPFLAEVIRSKEKDKCVAAIFKLKSRQIAKIYNGTFSSLAKKYDITIVAGSVVLSDPHIDEEGNLTTGNGKLYNVSVVYKPDGKPYPQIVYKLHPIPEEQSFVSPSPFTKFPVFDTPAGTLAVLICADSWFEEPYESFKGKNVDFIAIPSHNSSRQDWEMPHDLKPQDPEDLKINANSATFTEKDAWLKYSMVTRAPKAGIKYGLNIFMTGSLWKSKDNAYAIVYENGALTATPHHRGAALINLWIKK